MAAHPFFLNLKITVTVVKKLMQCIAVFVFIFPVFSSLYAQNTIFLETDYAIFRYDSTQVFWEFYYSLYRNELSYEPTENGDFSAEILLEFTIFKNDSLWSKNRWKTVDSVADTATNTLAKTILDRFYLLAPAGEYHGMLLAQDLNNPAHRDSIKFIRTVKPFSKEKPTLSDLELATSIKPVEKKSDSPFYKNQLMVLPNPSGFFYDDAQSLYFYVESYNLQTYPHDTYYKIQYYITDPVGSAPPSTFPVQLKRPVRGESKVEFGALRIAELSSGTYFLNFELLDSTDQVLVSRDKKFYVYSTEPVVDSSLAQTYGNQYLQSEFTTLSEADCDEEYKYMDYVLNSDMKSLYKAAFSVEDKRQALFSIWKRFDPDPGTVYNEFRRDYLRRIEYVNNKFSVMKREGWETDRGRVYLIYGAPDYIDRYPNEPEIKPYVIWHYYEVQGGVQFVFGDVIGLGDYQLLHSTMRGEIQNPDYRKMLGEHNR